MQRAADAISIDPPPRAPGPGPGTLGDRAWLAGLMLLLAIATWTAFSGAGAVLPLDSHEVLVARTGEEMLERHALLVPYLNDVPRLKKPPMNYWLTILANRLGDTGGVITELEARLPSIIAGIGLVMLTVWIGAMLLGRAMGLLAGLFLAASSGYTAYTHCARPEMLYAFFCTAGILGWLLSEKTWSESVEDASGDHSGGARWFAWLGWAAMGLAMLTKGPQLPGVLLAGFILYLVWTGRRKDITKILRPWSGLIIFVAVSAWWYVMAFSQVHGATVIWEEEMAQRVNAGQRHWWQWFEPYYLLHTPALLLPWVVFFVLALVSPWLGRLRGNRAVKFCWCLMVGSMLLLSLAWGRRWYYMLPVMAPMSILIAAVAVELGRMLAAKQWGRPVWMILLAVHAAGMIVLAFWEWRHQPPALAPPLAGLIALVVLAVAAGGLMPALVRRAGRDLPISSAALAAGVVAVCFPIMALHGSMWGESRLSRRAFALEVDRRVGHDEPLLGYTDTWVIEAYYAHRTITTVTTADAVGRTVAGRGQAWLLISDEANRKFRLPPGLQAQTVLSFDRAEGSDKPQPVSLLHVTPGPAAEAPATSPK